MSQVGGQYRDELEEVWVPKDEGELKGLLLTIQNEPGKKILKHKIQQALKEKRNNNWERWDRDEIDPDVWEELKEKRQNNWDQSWGDSDTGWHDGWDDVGGWSKDWSDFSPDWGEDRWLDIR